MNTDVSIVLYRPSLDEFARTVGSLESNARSIGTVRVLVSGDNAVRDGVRTVLEGARLEVDLVHRYDNLGFASGHNLLLARAFGDGAEYCLVLNPDILISADALGSLLGGAMQQAQALIAPVLLRAEPGGVTTDLVDSMGIGWSRSGRHFDIGQGTSYAEPPEGSSFAVVGVSGACLLVARSVYDLVRRETGWFFDDAFLAYREDAELGVRANAVGIQSIVLAIGGFAHVRSVRGYARGHALPDLLGVRNRFLLRWRLGRRRPGGRSFTAGRDAMVVLAALAYERTSLAGLRSAVSMRRYLTYTSRVRSR